MYAVGDLAGGMMLASTASMQGRHAALHALGATTEPLDLHFVPWTIFTQPEVASTGLTAASAAARRAPRRHHEALPEREPARRHLGQQRRA